MLDDTPEFVRRLSEELIQEQHECAICSEVLRRQQRLWSCTACYEVFHLHCIANWARSEAKSREEQLRGASTSPADARRDLFCCPLCRATQHTQSTERFWCFCGKVLDPAVDMMLVPGSCGQPCGRVRGLQSQRSDTNTNTDTRNNRNSQANKNNMPGAKGNTHNNFVMNRRTISRSADATGPGAQATSLCPHRCTLLCHPGPCPPCPRTRIQACYCGAQTKRVGCSSAEDGFECGAVCNKPLSCGHHRCTRRCHAGPCASCTETVSVSCYCGGQRRHEVNCAQRTESFSCGQPCTGRRDCGRHLCGERCHSGPCQPCLRTPARQRFCPCGKVALDVTQRTSCLDAVPSCGQRCDLPLPCGHGCPRVCHDDDECTPCAESDTTTTTTKTNNKNTCAANAARDDGDSAGRRRGEKEAGSTDETGVPDRPRGCGPCTEMHQIRCRCNAKLFTMPCFCRYLPQEQWESAARQTNLPRESLPTAYPPLCDRVCRRPLSCGRHTCLQKCCIDCDHTCLRECNRQLSCGKHKCGQLCHKGRCLPCTHMSQERLYCRCRRTAVEPPVPCGTGPVVCTFPCVVPRACGHAANHTCHGEATACPPCTQLVEKLCSSHQQPMPYYMPCFRNDVSCGAKCHKLLPCCKKLCELVCHAGPCTHRCTHDFPNFAELLKR